MATLEVWERKMTEQRLKNFKNLNREILTLDLELSEIQREITENQQTKGVYSLTDDQTRELIQLREILQRKIRQRWEERLALENWIERIADSQIRQAIRLRYIEGLRWQQVALRLGLKNEGTARIMVSRFLQKD